MPVMPCTLNGRPGFKYGESGKCYTYKAGDVNAMHKAAQKAHIQGYAIQQSQVQRGEEVK